MKHADHNPENASGQTAEPLDNRRRNFLIGAGVGTVGAAAALIGGTAAAPPQDAAGAAAQPDAKGYRETEHVRRYYGTTRI